MGEDDVIQALASPRAPPSDAPDNPDSPMAGDMTATPPWHDPNDPFDPGGQDGKMGLSPNCHFDIGGYDL